jgi:hypothetical protein
MSNAAQTCPTCETGVDFQCLGIGREGDRSWTRYTCRCGASVHDVDFPPDARLPLTKQAVPRLNRIMPHVVGVGATALTVAILPFFGEKIVLLLPLGFFGFHAVAYLTSHGRSKGAR